MLKSTTIKNIICTALLTSFSASTTSHAVIVGLAAKNWKKAAIAGGITAGSIVGVSGLTFGTVLLLGSHGLMDGWAALGWAILSVETAAAGLVVGLVVLDDDTGSFSLSKGAVAHLIETRPELASDAQVVLESIDEINARFQMIAMDQFKGSKTFEEAASVVAPIYEGMDIELQLSLERVLNEF